MSNHMKAFEITIHNKGTDQVMIDIIRIYYFYSSSFEGEFNDGGVYIELRDRNASQKLVF
jgi:hypothetical protein